MSTTVFRVTIETETITYKLVKYNKENGGRAGENLNQS